MRLLYLSFAYSFPEAFCRGQNPRFFFFFLEYFQRGVWERINDIKDDGLRKRAKNLKELACNRWADTTNKKYEAGWKDWTDWCFKHPESTTLPADDFYVALFINDLVIEKAKPGRIKTAVAGIRYAHTIARYDTPTDSTFLKMILEGALREAAERKTNNQKEPFQTNMLKEVVTRYAHTGDLMHLRFVITCLLGFSGFLRMGELLNIQLKDLTFEENCLKILIPKAKTDQHREGHIVHIARQRNDFCPVHWAERYVEFCNFNDKSSFLLCRLAKTKQGHRAIGARSLSRSTLSENLKKYLAPICGEKGADALGLHSLRSGGASAAINNGISERLIGKHGRWKGTVSRDRYLKDDETTRLSVTKALWNNI